MNRLTPTKTHTTLDIHPAAFDLIVARLRTLDAEYWYRYTDCRKSTDQPTEINLNAEVALTRGEEIPGEQLRFMERCPACGEDHYMTFRPNTELPEGFTHVGLCPRKASAVMHKSEDLIPLTPETLRAMTDTTSTP